MKKLSILAIIVGLFNFAALFVSITQPALAQLVVDRFSFTARPGISTFPVAAIRPTGAAQVVALDVMPSAGAMPHADNGYAWFDACDADILSAAGNVPVTCARMGIKPDRVEFGSRNWDGGLQKDVYIVRDRQVIARFHAGGLEVFGTVKAQAFIN
jgi:hypothetical protein